MKAAESSPIASPKSGWVLIARRQITAGGKVYPCGSEVPAAALANYQAMIDARFVLWCPPSEAQRPAARDLPPPAPPAKPKPEIEVVIVPGNLCESWRRTKRAYVEKCNGDVALAMDRLMLHKEASDLFLAAQKEAVARERYERKLQSLCPSDLLVPL